MHVTIPLRELIGQDDGSLQSILEGYHDCIGSDQEMFLKEKAIMMEKKNMCRTYLAIDGSRAILGYFSIGLRCMKIPRKDDGNEDRFNTKMNIDPDSRVAQSYLIGQLSRSRDAPKGFGKTMMDEAVNLIMDANTIVGCRLVRVDCDDKLIGYYSRYGFRPVKKNDDGDLNQMAYVLRTT